MTWALSRQRARWNCSTREDASYPRQGWETEKRGRQLTWSRRWDTTLKVLGL